MAANDDKQISHVLKDWDDRVSTMFTGDGSYVFYFSTTGQSLLSAANAAQPLSSILHIQSYYPTRKSAGSPDYLRSKRPSQWYSFRVYERYEVQCLSICCLLL